MARTLLIDMDYIKDNSILDDNVDETNGRRFVDCSTRVH